MKLICHPQFGLANRLRVLGSAIHNARISGRDLQVIWEKDNHCEASYYDLFDKSDFEVLPNQEETDLDSCVYYNAMSIDGNPSRPFIDIDCPSDIYIKTYCELNTRSSNTNLEFISLKKVVPLRPILEKIHSWDVFDMCGVHIRNLHAKNSNANYEKASENWTSNDQSKLVTFRSVSDPIFFAHQIRNMLNEDPNQKFFVCADSNQAIEYLKELFAFSIASFDLQKRDRSVGSVQDALAEIILLSQTKGMLGSYGSSFTEVAKNLGNLEIQYAGRDFRQVDSELIPRDYHKQQLSQLKIELMRFDKILNNPKS